MCAFAYDELGRGSGLAELYQRPEVADLLLCMACAAVNCPTEVGSWGLAQYLKIHTGSLLTTPAS